MIRFVNATSKSDIETIKNLADVTWHEHYKSIISNEQIDYMLGRFLTNKAIKEHIDIGGKFYIIEYDGLPVGFFAFDVLERLIFIDKVYILHDYRHRHIGKSVMDFIEKIAKENDKKGMYLTVNKYNKSSIKAYRSYGFLIEGNVTTDIGNGFVMDDFRMYKFFR